MKRYRRPDRPAKISKNALKRRLQQALGTIAPLSLEKANLTFQLSSVHAQLASANAFLQRLRTIRVDRDPSDPQVIGVAIAIDAHCYRTLQNPGEFLIDTLHGLLGKVAKVLERTQPVPGQQTLAAIRGLPHAAKIDRLYHLFYGARDHVLRKPPELTDPALYDFCWRLTLDSFANFLALCDTVTAELKAKDPTKP